MANPYSYTVRRRVLLQIAMVAILLATGGLAALVTRSRTYAPPVELAAPVELGAFQVSLPKEWTVAREVVASVTATEQLVATEPPESKGRPPERVMEIVAHPMGVSMSPRKYIRTMHSIQGEIESTRITVDGAQGELFELESRGGGVDTRLVASHLYAVAVVDSNYLLIVHLAIPLRSSNAADRRLMRDVAAAIKRK